MLKTLKFFSELQIYSKTCKKNFGGPILNNNTSQKNSRGKGPSPGIVFFFFFGGGGSKNLDLGSGVKQRICLSMVKFLWSKHRIFYDQKFWTPDPKTQFFEDFGPPPPRELTCDLREIDIK